MNQKQYVEWRNTPGAMSHAVFLKHQLDPIVIMGIPTGRECDRLIEGIVVQSDIESRPVNYTSLAWCGEHFEIVQGSVSFTPSVKAEVVDYVCPGYAIFTGEGGYEGERRQALAWLGVGKAYEVVGGREDRFSTHIKLKDIPGDWNTAMFVCDRDTLPIERYADRYVIPDKATTAEQGPGEGWQRVSFAADCLGGDQEEPGYECSVCGGIYDECPCPGPTQDGYEYKEFDGVMYARSPGADGSPAPEKS